MEAEHSDNFQISLSDYHFRSAGRHGMGFAYQTKKQNPWNVHILTKK